MKNVNDYLKEVDTSIGILDGFLPDPSISDERMALFAAVAQVHALAAIAAAIRDA